MHRKTSWYYHDGGGCLKEDDNNEHEASVAAIEDMSVEFVILILRPEKNKLRDEERIGYNVKSDKPKERFGQEPRSVPPNGLKMEYFRPEADDQ